MAPRKKECFTENLNLDTEMVYRVATDNTNPIFGGSGLCCFIMLTLLISGDIK